MSASMETEAGDECIVLPPSSGREGSTILLHPLALINISDHHTRTRVQTHTQDPLIIGLLYGRQNGRETEILNTLELCGHIHSGESERVSERVSESERVNVSESVSEGAGESSGAVSQHAQGEIVVDQAFMQQRMAQFKEVFKTLEHVGWYVTHTGAPTRAHLNFHRQLYRENEGVVFLQLDTHPAPHATELPITLYETALDPQQRVVLCSSEYKLATEEAERIGVSLVAHHSTLHPASMTSQAAAHATASSKSEAAVEPSQLTLLVSEQANAVKMLTKRIATLRQYLVDVQSGALPSNSVLLRQVSRVCSRLPIHNHALLNDTLLRERNDVLLQAMLASATRACHAIADAADKFGHVHEKRKSRFL